MKRSRRITVDLLSRVEGEGALHLTVDGDRVVDLRLDIFEPPRFFEAFLRGRRAAEVPDLTARICGICASAYQTCAAQALECLCASQPDPAVPALRRLLACGEWIQSHALHVHMLAAPDFLGCESALALADKDRAAVERGLRIRKAGNEILRLVGGRSVHPVSVCVGGFSHAPRRDEVKALREPLLRALDDAIASVLWVATFELPGLEDDIEFVSLRHPQEYPMNEGRILSSRGLDRAAAEFGDCVEEYQVAHSTALHARLRGRGPYLVGPLARLNLNLDRFGPEMLSLIRETGVHFPSCNPSVSIVARALEIVYALGEALRLIDGYAPPQPLRVPLEAGAGISRAAVEAPRGLLFQAYETDEAGVVRSARIVPPTSQNQARIEADLRRLGPQILCRDRGDAVRLCEQVIRNYDPCISCATHFLDLRVEVLPDAAPAGAVDRNAGSVRIIGIGSRLGDDAVGLEAAQLLMNDPALQAEVAIAPRGGVDLAGLLPDEGPIILIDGVVSGAKPGTLHDLSLQDLQRGSARGLSSHSLQLSQMVHLPARLRGAPLTGRLLGIEIARCAAGVGAPLTETARAGVRCAVARARRWVEYLRGASGPPPA